MINPIPITIRDSFSAVISEDVKYLATNSGPQIIKFCNGIIAVSYTHLTLPTSDLV